MNPSAKPSGLLLSAVTYIMASLLSALAGYTIAAHFFSGSSLIGNAMSATVAVFFHLLLSASVKRAPEFIVLSIEVVEFRDSPVQNRYPSCQFRFVFGKTRYLGVETP